MLWAFRLSAFLFYRILKTGSDSRFDDKRDKFFSFLGFWVFQMIWVWTVSMPVTILNSPNVLQYRQPRFNKASDIIGVIIFALAWGLEAISDIQKYRWKNSAAGKEPGAVADIGFWKYSRHPNYFAEIMAQVGTCSLSSDIILHTQIMCLCTDILPAIYIIAVTPTSYRFVPRGTGASAALFASCVGWILLTVLLLFISGLTLQERPGAKKRYEKGDNWPAYEKYLNETSILFPMPKFIWRNLPVWVKRTVGLEFPIYVFDPKKHADMDKVRENRAENGERASSEPLRA
jgi:steroid 5-alpha reductase family enzyme